MQQGIGQVQRVYAFLQERLDHMVVVAEVARGEGGPDPLHQLLQPGLLDLSMGGT